MRQALAEARTVHAPAVLVVSCMNLVLQIANSPLPDQETEGGMLEGVAKVTHESDLKASQGLVVETTVISRHCEPAR